MPEHRWILTRTDILEMLAAISVTDVDALIRIIEDHSYRIFSEDGSDDDRVAEWLRDRGWTCERED